MAKKIDALSVEELVNELVCEGVDINALSLDKATQREAFLAAVAQRHGLLDNIAPENAQQFLEYLLSVRPDDFIYIKKDRYTNKLVQMYLESRLAQTRNLPHDIGAPVLQTSKSYNDELAFTYLYATTEEDELYYHDYELGVPVALRSSLKAILKLTNGIKLLEKIDMNVAEIGEMRICAIINDIIIAQYKETMFSYVNENKTGYYSLCASCRGLEKEIAAALAERFEEYGIEVVRFTIKKMAIPKDILNKVENLAFQLRQKRVNMQAEYEFSQKSIESYEAKLAVQQKYGVTEPQLTEHEKDLALQRYLTKIGRATETKVDHSIHLQAKAEAVDEAIEKSVDVVPDIVPKKDNFRRNFLIAAIILAIVCIIIAISAQSTGVVLIVLGSYIAIMGIVVACNHEKIVAKKSRPSKPTTPSEEDE